MKRWLSKLLHKTLRRSKSTHTQPDPEKIRDPMADPQSSSIGNDKDEMSPVVDLHTNSTMNIIDNHDFSKGLDSWYPNCCNAANAYVASEESGLLSGITANSGVNYAVMTSRTECWQGLEQDITGKVTVGTSYNVSAYVRICGSLQGPADVLATLKLEYPNSVTNYLSIGRIPVNGNRWEKLEGSFSLTNMPSRVVFFLEGPPPGVDLLIDSVIISYSCLEQFERSPVVDLHASSATNIVENHDFSKGLQSWYPNCCQAYVASGEHSFLKGAAAYSGSSYAVVTKRTECWQGLEQEITGKVTVGTSYKVSAYVGICGGLQGLTEVQATVKLEYPNSDTNYLSVGRIPVKCNCWERLEGSFSLVNMPNRVVFYLEGPPSGVDLLIDSVIISCSSLEQFKESKRFIDGDVNIILNPCFEDGVNNWSARGCKIFVHNSLGDGKITPLYGRFFASATDRKQSWNGIQQDICGKVKRKLAYEVTAVVRIFGNASANVCATLWVQSQNGREQYIGIASLRASDKEWVTLQGKFLLNGIASKAVIYLEGPPMGTDILVNSLVVKRAKKLLRSSSPDIEGLKGEMVHSRGIHDINIISNHDFSSGLLSWSLNSCDGYVVSGESSLYKGVTAVTGMNYAIITNRTEAWQGLEQDITSKISVGPTYSVSAYVRTCGGQNEPAPVIATLKLEYLDSPPSFVFVGRTLVSKEQWEKLEGSFFLESMPTRVVFFIEGPPPGKDLLIDSVKVFHSGLRHSPMLYGVNIIDNSNLNQGLKGWSPLGSCTLSICDGAPYVLPAVARDSLSHHEPLSGRHIVATNRTEIWMGPSQTVTGKLKLHLTYQIAAWVRVGSGASGPQNVNVALGVDDQWVNGGQVQATNDRWNEVSGSFRIEKQPSKVIVYVQGPPPGVDLMVAGLHMFPVDRKARFELLKEKTDKVRKRDIVLKFRGKESSNVPGVSVKVTQVKNSFPFGSCINRSNIENEEFVDFFLRNFNWAVFGNELKWYAIEPEQGKYNYKDADEMLDFCKRHGIETRGHCIFWEVEDTIQPWVRSLNQNDLMIAIQNRLRGLLSRYKGKFRHYDVNNEMLHGSFYQDRLGKDIRAYMFREAHKMDPSATLFVNDYNVEDGCDSKSTPEMYVQQILDLQERGALVGGIGIQGHVSNPVGPIVCAALDKLEILGLPIWFTELDVVASNEHVRADDLEVMLREAYAHPSVEGIVLWGFWELFMCREGSHLVDAEGDINEAGQRYLALRKEWMSHADGHINTDGEFRFRGYQGTYNIEVTTPRKKSSQSFVVEKGETPLVLTINL
ncbi:uncharacterized protein LOC109834338 isoform X2 [Asparagus officinalis]|uniref:uncharacterized protein LOC109834338 isoform X2 n=1 Tax=Asparagus officinalis TaxID=4686 RepID=UPI00098E74F4|nr:uncharacterized protein LOC109834338 isoform X2 [Asparagus officinalis]